MKLQHLPLLLITLLLAAPAAANDHNDGSIRGLRGLDGDLTAFYAWISPDGTKLDLVLPWAPDSDSTSRFSDATVWAVRIASRPSPSAEDAGELLVLCTFDVAQHVSCWAGDEEYVNGDASTEAGIFSESKRLRVFAGLRNDPFFFNLEGFKTAAARLGPALSAAPRDAAGCPSLEPGERAEIVAQLAHGQDASAPRDSFTGQSVLTIALELDLSLATSGGPILAVAASTHRRR